MGKTKAFIIAKKIKRIIFDVTECWEQKQLFSETIAQYIKSNTTDYPVCINGWIMCHTTQYPILKTSQRALRLVLPGTIFD